MNNAELIAALRCCIVDFNSTQSRRCNECPYRIYADGKKACENKAKRDATDVLEADEKFHAELIKNIEHWKKQVIRLRAQLPKEGEWIFSRGDGKTCVDGWTCSACGNSFHTNVPYFEEFHYCPNCGARMRGEHDEQ